MAATPAFVATPVIGAARILTANTNRDGTGTLGTLATGASGGTRIDRVQIRATGTTTVGVIRLFDDDGAGNIRLLDEILVTAITPSTSVAVFSAEKVRNDGLAYLILPSGHILKAGTHNAETFDVIAMGGNF